MECSTYQKPLYFLLPFVGFVYLNSYLNAYRIPFPVELSVLPALLLICGMISIVICVLLLVYAVLASLMSLDVLSVDLHSLINVNPRYKGSRGSLITIRAGNYVRYVLYTYVIPFLAFLVFVGYADYYLIDFRAAIILLVYLLWLFTYGLYLGGKTEGDVFSRLVVAVKLALHIFILHVFSIASFAVFLTFVLSRAHGITDTEYMLICAAFVIINSFCMLFTFSKDKFDEAHSSEVALSSEEIIRRSQTSPLKFVLVIFFAFSLFPPFSVYIGELSLKLINLGRMDAMVTLKDVRANCDAWPKYFKNSIKEDVCVSKPVRKIVQFGSRAYFLLVSKDDGPIVVSVDVSRSVTAQKLPEDSIYRKALENVKY